MAHKGLGRGLKYEHLTKKENEEKFKNPDVIGKSGRGLKDAVETFDRKGVKVSIKTKYGDITLGKSHKLPYCKPFNFLNEDSLK